MKLKLVAQVDLNCLSLGDKREVMIANVEEVGWFCFLAEIIISPEGTTRINIEKFKIFELAKTIKNCCE